MTIKSNVGTLFDNLIKPFLAKNVLEETETSRCIIGWGMDSKNGKTPLLKTFLFTDKSIS